MRALFIQTLTLETASAVGGPVDDDREDGAVGVKTGKWELLRQEDGRDRGRHQHLDNACRHASDGTPLPLVHGVKGW